MERTPSESWLEEMLRRHLVTASVFAPFVVARLSEEGHGHEALLTVRLRGLENRDEAVQMLCLRWSPETAVVQLPPVQDNTVTEWAALGVALAVLPHFTGMTVRRPATPGNSFDYWISDGRWQYGLEVSGTMAAGVEGRHREKVEQLRANPYGMDGCVIAVSFAMRVVILSINLYAETAG
jgi:hypothetical protein